MAAHWRTPVRRPPLQYFRKCTRTSVPRGRSRGPASRTRGRTRPLRRDVCTLSSVVAETKGSATEIGPLAQWPGPAPPASPPTRKRTRTLPVDRNTAPKKTGRRSPGSAVGPRPGHLSDQEHDDGQLQTHCNHKTRSGGRLRPFLNRYCKPTLLWYNKNIPNYPCRQSRVPAS
jgi:hypothetical protein